MASSPTGADGPEREVLDAEDARYRAMLAADTAALGALLDEQLTYTHSSGTRDTRESLLRKIADGALVYREIAHPVDQVAIVGDTAVVAGKMIGSVVLDGAPLQLDNSTLSVWVRQQGTWRLLGFQPTPLGARKPE
ncbi:nuclear transport factor 2 family protein [Pseudonocardia humida]|uniref:Nuclear transport factor 2 family protein n=1 Tax=Pseudonocardia humida TaxID=2800819 RepID=A0ABT1A6D3_9PSEU|nr:nuclear transport factor 2 family protein [Pseudonocardia humida]MCO1658568.1 nuclear transport factor 2 family protein [Pseudonocardia humida]